MEALCTGIQPLDQHTGTTTRWGWRLALKIFPEHGTEMGSLPCYYRYIWGKGSDWMSSFDQTLEQY
jgi:hypothetical protein